MKLEVGNLSLNAFNQIVLPILLFTFNKETKFYVTTLSFASRPRSYELESLTYKKYQELTGAKSMKIQLEMKQNIELISISFWSLGR